VIAEMDRRSGGAAHDAIVQQGTGVGGITGHSCEKDLKSAVLK
jgi:hypothetical protein